MGMSLFSERNTEKPPDIITIGNDLMSDQQFHSKDGKRPGRVKSHEKSREKPREIERKTL
jgi:hypothetical protein